MLPHLTSLPCYAGPLAQSLVQVHQNFDRVCKFLDDGIQRLRPRWMGYFLARLKPCPGTELARGWGLNLFPRTKVRGLPECGRDDEPFSGRYFFIPPEDCLWCDGGQRILSSQVPKCEGPGAPRFWGGLAPTGPGAPSDPEWQEGFHFIRAVRR